MKYDFMAMRVHIMALCVVTSCCLVGAYNCFRGTYTSIFYPEDGGRNGKHLKCHKPENHNLK